VIGRDADRDELGGEGAGGYHADVLRVGRRAVAVSGQLVQAVSGEE
jgi:hypothetical protein